MRVRLALVILLGAAVPAAPQSAIGQSATARDGGGGVSQSAPNAPRSLIAVPVGTTAPVVDGRLDDAGWALAPVATDFIQTRPHPGEPSSFRTEVRVLYDHDAVYVAARMFDPHPDSIVAQLTRRDDRGVSDFLEIAFDSYHDRRTGYVFGLSPRGVKEDVFLFDDTKSDASWDPVWQGAARVDSLGWTAEFRIPLSQLRFNVGRGADGDKQVWGVEFKRTIGRSSEESFWAPIPLDGSKVVSIFGEMSGLTGLRSPRRLEVMPYSVGKLTRSPGDAADPFHKASAWDGTAGADVKYGLTSNLTVTAALNPDFGQVEADPSVVNLSAFETFFPEKRPFFLEGADIFRFGTGVGDGDFGNESLFYSRRIGRAPQLGVPDAADYSSVPAAAPILGAAKLSGKTAGGWSIGVLDAVTGRATAPYVTGAGVRGVAPVEPLTNYGVARLIRSSSDGQSALGAIFTATDRQLNATTFRDDLAASAYVGGLNFRQRFARGSYEASGWVVGSEVLGSDSAIAQRQRDPSHFFQRPDGKELTYDPSRTSLGGWAASGQVFKLTGAWTWGVVGNVRSPGFDVNDLGYQQNADMVLGVLFGGWNMLKPKGSLRTVSVNTDLVGVTDFAGMAQTRTIEGNVNFNLMNNWNGGFYANRDLGGLNPSELRGGPALWIPGSSRMNAWGGSDSRKAFGASANVNAWHGDDGSGRDVGVYPSLWVRPNTRMELSMGPGISWHRSGRQYVTTEDDAAGTSHYVFADLAQTTVSMTTRLSYTFSPTLSFQLYAQPFTSAGAYTGFKEVRSPRAHDGLQRFQTFAPAEIGYDAADDVYHVGGGTGFSFDQPNFGVRQLRSNALLRWEWRPGSTLFLVWSQGRSDDDTEGQFRFNHDVSQLFNTRATNVLLIKASYWIGT